MKEELKKVLGGLKDEDVLGVALVDKKGNLIESDLPPAVHDETFGMMSATIMGASSRASPKLSEGGVKRSIVHSQEGNIILSNTDKNMILSVLIDGSSDIDTYTEKVDAAVKEIKKLF
ncbi:MAG: roadblock/LC7 domain-containing protein [Candidatus Natronoplasma sp.]